MGQPAQTPLSELPASGVTDVFNEIKCALQALQVQQQQIMSQNMDDGEQSLCLLDQILDLHIQHMEQLVMKGRELVREQHDRRI